MKLFTLPLFLTLALMGQAQTVPAAPATTVVKSTPASDALVAAAKDMQTEQKALDTARQQAQSTLDSSQKSIQDQLQVVSKKLNDDIHADKKYKAQFDKMAELNKQLQDIQNTASQKFQAAAGALQSKVATDKALVDGLVPIVRKENELPDSATFDVGTQSWKR